MSDGEALLSVVGASKVYRMGDVEVHALRDASLDVQRGEFLAVLGPSGSGKSTLLNLIGGMDRPTSGQVQYGGRDLSQASDTELTLYRRHNIGFVFQFYNLVPSLTALENVQVATELAAEPLDPLEALRLVDVADRAGHFPAQLSGGQQQRVAIARAVAGNPALLLCDEPTGALDHTTSQAVLELLGRLHRDLNKTVVVITHDPAMTAMADRVATIVDGRIESVRSGPNGATDAQETAT